VYEYDILLSKQQENILFIIPFYLHLYLLLLLLLSLCILLLKA